jgi:glycerate-2-kinase
VGAHPTPDESSVKAGQKARNFFKDIPSKALIITLISGGTSSLLCFPQKGISIADIEKTFKLLNESGATIREINTVRKHCSQIKGGQLLQLLDPRVQLIDLVISDVPDDDLSIIGSGPTVEDPSTFLEARQILQHYEIWNRLPHSVRNHITDGIKQKVSETLKPGSDPLDTHTSHVMSSARTLAQTIGALASSDGLDYQVADGPFNEDVRLVADEITNTITGNSRTKLFVFYGESTVTVTGSGKGGRNQELALYGALQIEGKKQFTWLGAGTDGIDGPTDAAGAIVDGQTISKAREQGLNLQKYLADNDSYHFHEKMGTLFKTGPTGNNLMDVVLVKTGD